MKKIVYLLCIFSSYSFSQFNSTNETTIGASQIMYQCDSSSSNFSTIVGNGVTWDYSDLYKIPNGTKTYSVIANDNTTDYPDANKIFQIEGVLKNYVKTDASGRTQYGFNYQDANINATTNYTGSDPMELMTYPFSLNSTLNDIFSGTITTNQPVNPAISGKSKSTVDGFGTLKISNQTFNDVTRYHLIDTVNASTFLGPVKIIIDQYEYFDLSGSFSAEYLPIMNYTTIKIILTSPITLNLVLSAVDPIYFVGNNELTKNEINIGPNPVNNEINLYNIENNITNYELFSVDGKLVSSGVSNGKIDVSRLNKGSYFLNVFSKGNNKMIPFVKD